MHRATVRRGRARSVRRLLERPVPDAKLDAVTKVFRTGMFGGKQFAAVSGVSFEIEPGEVVSLIGESGSGKTTVGRMILRLTGLTAGSITFDGQDVSTISRRDLRGYYSNVQGVFQDPFSSYNPVFKADRVFELIRGNYLSGLSQAEWNTKLRTSLEAVGLEPADVLGKYPHQLSGGQLQRLLIARALLLDIRILVADEIISMLDASTRIDVLNLLGDLKARGLGILFVTHDLSLGNYISDKTIILRHGQIVEMGATQKVFGRPGHAYTKMLLDSVPQLHRKWAVTQSDAAAPDLHGTEHGVLDATPALVESRERPLRRVRLTPSLGQSVGRHAGHRGEHVEEHREVLLADAHAVRGGEKLVRDRGRRQRHLELATELEREVHVLLHHVTVEPGLVRAARARTGRGRRPSARRSRSRASPRPRARARCRSSPRARRPR